MALLNSSPSNGMSKSSRPVAIQSIEREAHQGYTWADKISNFQEGDHVCNKIDSGVPFMLRGVVPPKTLDTFVTPSNHHMYYRVLSSDGAPQDPMQLETFFDRWKSADQDPIQIQVCSICAISIYLTVV